jgi:hypothetical protein
MRIGQVLLTLVAGLAIAPGFAHADLLSVGTGLTVTWDRTAQPSGSAVMTIPIFNSNTSDPRGLAGWTLAIRIVPEAGATGTLAFGTFSYPANEIISPSSNIVPAGSPSVTTSSNGIQVGASNSDLSTNGQNPVPASGAALFSVNYTSTDALGTFDIYAWNRTSGAGSYWTDQFGLGNTGFTNIPSAAPSVNDLLLGTVTVTATPEPGTMLLAFLASGGIATHLVRRRRRPQDTPSDADTAPTV